MLQSHQELTKQDNPLPAVGSGRLSNNECIALLQWMLRWDTTALQAREAGFVVELSRYLSARSISSTIIQGDEGRANLVATLDSGRAGPHLVFCGHCDTVPLGAREWKKPPFGGLIEDGRIFGRGSSDMKGGLAALIASMFDIQIDENWVGQLSLAVTYGEETGSEGARLMASDGSLAPFHGMVIAEPTSNRVVRSHKGALWLAFTSTGRTAHGSMPQTGLNALEMAVGLRQRLLELDMLTEQNQLLGRPTICLTGLKGGAQVNVIPDRAFAEFDMRTLPGQNHEDILATIHAVARETEAEYEGGQIVVETINSLHALDTPVDSAIVRAALDTRSEMGLESKEAGGASYFTDGSVLQAVGADILILGPGDPSEAHQTDESLDVQDFLVARHIYTGIARRFLNPS